MFGVHIEMSLLRKENVTAQLISNRIPAQMNRFSLQFIKLATKLHLNQRSSIIKGVVAERDC